MLQFVITIAITIIFNEFILELKFSLVYSQYCKDCYKKWARLSAIYNKSWMTKQTYIFLFALMSSSPNIYAIIYKIKLQM